MRDTAITPDTQKQEVTHSRFNLRDSFLQRVLTVVGIVTSVLLVLLLLWYGAQVLLLIFAGILLAVFLRSLTDGLSARSPLSDGWSLTVVVLALLTVFGVGGWLLAPQVFDQVDQLTQQLPQSIDYLEQRITQYEWGRRLLQTPPANAPTSDQIGNAVTKAAGFVSTVVGAITSFAIIIVIGVYFAAQPALYTHGVVRLVPLGKRQRVWEVLDVLGYTLRWWLVGQLFSMTVVGVLTAVGLWVLQVPLALTLGLIAALLTFIPYIGPIISAVPAVLLALMQDPMLALYVTLLYAAIQFVESNFLTPLIQQRTVSLPPVLIITAQVLMGVLVGALGVVLATPLTAVVLVLVKMLYVEDTLGDSIDVWGEP